MGARSMLCIIHSLSNSTEVQSGRVDAAVPVRPRVRETDNVSMTGFEGKATAPRSRSDAGRAPDQEP